MTPNTKACVFTTRVISGVLFSKQSSKPTDFYNASPDLERARVWPAEQIVLSQSEANIDRWTSVLPLCISCLQQHVLHVFQSLVEQRWLLHVKDPPRWSMLSCYKEVHSVSTKTCANIWPFWFTALSHHRKRDRTSGTPRECLSPDTLFACHIQRTCQTHSAKAY